MLRRMRVVVTVAGAAALLAACGGSDSGNDALPPGSGSEPVASSGPTLSATATPGTTVLSSYLSFWDAVVAANKASDPALPALTTAAAEPQLERVRKVIRVNKTQGISLRGTVGHKPKVTSSSGAAATVEDCYDVSAWNPVDARTGAKIDVTDANGTGRYKARYTLRRTGGGWQVTDQAALGGC